MKDFVKWLGVNEKVAKVVVWLLIIMVTLIIFNTAMESLGFPYYAITYKNMLRINNDEKLVNFIVGAIMSFLNFYSIVLLVFRVKEAKSILKYAILYMIMNYFINIFLGYSALQVFIILFILTFCYLYSNKNIKYIIYSILAFISTTIIQGVWFLSKARFIDYTKLNYSTKSILSLDYFIIMAIIILVKEIYLKKRGEKLCGLHQDAGYGLVNSKTKANSQRKSQKK